MRTLALLLTSASLMLAAGTVPTRAGYVWEGCHSCTPTFMSILHRSGSHGVPEPTRQGNMVGHFDSVGAPQSIVTPVETSEEIVEVPCEPVYDTYSQIN